jgi:hypothetical protein
MDARRKRRETMTKFVLDKECGSDKTRPKREKATEFLNELIDDLISDGETEFEANDMSSNSLEGLLDMCNSEYENVQFGFDIALIKPKVLKRLIKAGNSDKKKHQMWGKAYWRHIESCKLNVWRVSHVDLHYEGYVVLTISFINEDAAEFA